LTGKPTLTTRQAGHAQHLPGHNFDSIDGWLGGCATRVTLT